MKYKPWLVWSLVALLSPAAFADADFIPAEPLRTAALAKFWQLQLPLEEDQHVRDFHLVDDQLYVGTDDGYVFAVDATTGVTRWLQPVTRSTYALRRPDHAGERVIFATPVDLQVYDRYSGDPIARRDLTFPAGTGVVCDAERIYIGSLNDRLHALSLENQFTVWRGLTTGPVSVTPVLFGDHVFVADENGAVTAAAREDKQFLWRATTRGPIVADLHVDQRGVFVASRDHTLYLLDLGFGKLRWRVRFEAPLLDPPFVGPELVYQYAQTQGVAAIETGLPHEIERRIRWMLPQGRRVLTVDDDHVYMQSRANDLLVVRKKDGKLLHTVPTSDFELSAPSLRGNAIFLAARDGRLFCARPEGVPHLRRADLLRALQAGTETPLSEVRTVPTTQPAAQVEDYLRSRRTGAPLGGKSKVSEGFKGGDAGQ